MKTELKNFCNYLIRIGEMSNFSENSINDLVDEFLNSEQSDETPTIKENEDKKEFCDCLEPRPHASDNSICKKCKLKINYTK